MGEVRARIRVYSGDGGAADSLDATAASIQRGPRASQTLMCKEFCIVDDMLNVADTASVTVANIDGENTGKFECGQRIEIDEADDDVAGGSPVRMFTGRITNLEFGSDIGGGSIIRIDAMDLGWHLTSCDAKPLVSTLGGTLKQLIGKLIDSSWGFVKTTTGVSIDDNLLNRSLKQGRQGYSRQFIPPQQKQYMYIQVEPGQKPIDVLRTYLQREGLLINVSARGGLVLFRPDYTTESPYDGVYFHAVQDARHTRNNVVGRPSLSKSIEGMYSEVQCWSTVVKPLAVQDTAISVDPNAAYTHYFFKPDSNPLPFYRRAVFMDGEAINADMRKMRAIYKYQLDGFNSWRYEVDLQGHSQRNAFIVSDTMMTVNDGVHQVRGTYYVQSVRRSCTLGEGARVHLTLRKPIIDPTLQRQVGGGGKIIGK